MALVAAAAGYVAAVVLTFLAGTVVFDVIHAALHAAFRSRWAWLRAVGALHDVHHRFLDRELQVHPELIRANVTHHVVPEFLTQVAVTVLLGLLVLPAAVVAGAVAIEVVVVTLILRCRGIDLNHRPYTALPAYRPTAVFCVPHYHALHHVFPDAYYGSWLKLLDQLLGVAAWLRGRRVLVTGAGRPLGAALVRALERAGAVVTAAGRPEGVDLGAFDVVVLLHAEPGREGAYVPVVERFVREASGRKVAPEVWAVVPEGAVEPAFVRHSRGYLFDARVHWRHVVVPVRAFGAEEAAAQQAARRILFWVRRGMHFVPAGAAVRGVLGFFRFRFETEAVCLGPVARVVP